MNPLQPPEAGDGEPEVDAVLREALRHAPDATLAPSPALSAAILREARAAVQVPAPAPAPRASVWPTLLALWAALARPSMAAGFASVMVAGVVGLLWFERPIDDPAFRPTPEAAATRAPAAAPQPVAPAPVPVPAPTPPPLAERPAAPAAAAVERRVRPAEPARKAAAEPQPPPVVADAPAVSAAAAPAETAAPGASGMASMYDSAARQRSELRAAPADRAAAAAAAPVTPAAPATLALTEGNAVQARRAIALLRMAIAREPQRWRWQRDGGTSQAMNDALAQWLAELESAAGSRWQGAPAAERLETDAAASELRLFYDGSLRHVLRIERDAVHWQGTAGAGFQWQAAVPAGGLRPLPPAAP